MLQWLKLLIYNAINLRPCVQGVFDPIGGTYDEQTSFEFDPTMLYEARTRSIVGAFSKGSKTPEDQMMAGGAGKTLDNTAVIIRKKIDTGDMFRHTRQEHMTGTTTLGDQAVVRGDFIKYKNLESRVNMIKTPALPLPGEMSMQRVRKSISDPKSDLRREVVDYLAEEMEFEFFLAMLWGASKACLDTEANGGLAVNLGISGTAGNALMAKNFYSIDAGWETYSDVPATWNTTVNDHVATCTAAGDSLTILKTKVMRAKLDELHFAPVTLDGTRYKAIALVDSDTWYRLDHLLHDEYENAKPRAADHEIFGVNHQLVYHEILWLNVPNLKKYRAAYDGTQGWPDVGPNMTSDPRTYTTSSSVAWVCFVGAGAVFEGYSGSGRITTETGYHSDGWEVGARTKLGYIRGEWFAKDGRASASANCYCNSYANAIFYETGVNSLT